MLFPSGFLFVCHFSGGFLLFPGGFLIFFPGPGGSSNFLNSWHQEFGWFLFSLWRRRRRRRPMNQKKRLTGFFVRSLKTGGP